MGLWKSNLQIFLENKKNNKGDLLTLGSQHCNFNYEEIKKFFAQKNYPICQHKFYKNNLKNVKKDSINSKTFFEMLGFSKIDELDFDNYEGSNLIGDLNKIIEVKKKYDFVFDGGTVEHVFNVKNSMTNVVNFLKPGGIIMHSFPLSGWVNHGYYSFSPCMFYEFYLQNKFDNFEFYIIENYKYINREKYFKVENIYSDFNNNSEIKKTLGVFLAKKTTNMDITLPIQDAYKKSYLNKKLNFYKTPKKKFSQKFLIFIKIILEIISDSMSKIK